MATFIPFISSCSSKMTPGERRLARQLEKNLDEQCLCWFDTQTGGRYPDFIILNPQRGLLFLEVKDWKLENIRNITKQSVEYLKDGIPTTLTNPLEQVRQCSFAAIKTLERDTELLQQNDLWRNKLCLPYSYGVVFSNISRKQFYQAIPAEWHGTIFPAEKLFFSEDISESVTADQLQDRLWKMFPWRMASPLTAEQIDRFRWHIFPEIRIHSHQAGLFDEDEEESIPDICKIMDTQQELLARSLGEGHRVIHGVAGSGKTLILLYRCAFLAETVTRPVLVLCYNILLASKLRSLIAARSLSDKVVVCHFHDWCNTLVKRHQLSLISPDKKYYEQLVDTVKQAIADGKIPHYGAILVDEGHDMEAEWLTMIASTIDPATNSLLFMYDDAQSIYKKKGTLGFSLASVGIQAQGRTSILRLNYRNTREILQFAYNFAKESLNGNKDELSEIIQPKAAGINGIPPEIKEFETLSQEVSYIRDWILKERNRDVPWREIAIIYPTSRRVNYLKKVLSNSDIPFTCIQSQHDKRHYDSTQDAISILPLPSSKGLEFHSVIIPDCSFFISEEDNFTDMVRRLYVGFTRATTHLLVSWSEQSTLSEALKKTVTQQ